MSAIVRFDTEVIHRYVYELRYDFGQLYWDRSGRVAKRILNAVDGWDFESVDGSRCLLSNRTQNIAFNFGSEKLDLSQTQSADVETLIEVGDFAKLAEDATKPVIESLELELFSRIGFRVWHLYPTADPEQANQFISDLSLFRIDTTEGSLIRNASEIAYRAVTDRGSYMLRIAIAPFEQNIQLSPRVLMAASGKP